MQSTLRPLALAITAAVAAPEVFAQAALEEVVVSARKRNETLEDAPVSVRAFTENEIESAGITSPQDFINLTPNVTLVQAQNTGVAFLNIRGVSQARNTELSAAVLIDGVLMSNPTQFNQQLFDIEQIEVLRGPQGALYGRNAIGGAITINTKQPGDEFEGKIMAGVDSGPGYTVRGTVSGPITEDLRFRLSGSQTDTDGFIKNEYLGEEADPFQDTSLRARLIWDATENLSADLRVSYSDVQANAVYYRIAAEADDTSVPVTVNNPGNNEREFLSASFKLEWLLDAGTLTAITAYDDLSETMSGDQFNFLPREAPFNFFNNDPFGAFIKTLTGDEFTDLSQNQYFEVEAWSQEVRFASPEDKRLRWIAGAYAIATERYISTGNQIDRGLGVFDVKKDFRPSVFVDPTDPSPQLNILADGQDNFAWAVFGQVAYDINDTLEASFSLRYDKDEREQTTLTPPLYNTSGLDLQFGDQRDDSWDAWQPKLTLRYQPNDDLTLYADVSRGFRSGGFNQTGVGEAVPTAGVADTYDEQIADTYEIGAKSVFWDGRANASLALYYTDFEGAYFFLFDPGTSTQNVGTLNEVEYLGLEFEASAAFTDSLSGYFGLGLTDSEITDSADPTQEGNQAPLVSEYTMNLGAMYRQPVGILGGADFVARADLSRIGDTWWEPNNVSKRSTIDLLDLRVGFEVEDNWSVMAWAKNALDEDYNAEFSPGPAAGFNFLWPARPVQYGVEFTKRF